MTAAELRDDYLLSIGCSIADKYTYIKDTGYKYFENRDDGFVTVNGKNLPLNSKVSDTRALNSLIRNANNSLANSVAGEMKDKLGGDNAAAIVDVCSFALECAKNYFADFFKYVYKCFSTDEATLKRLITLNDASLGALSAAFDDVFKKHSINVNEARADAANFHSRLNAETVASAAAAPTRTYGTTYYNNSWGGSATTYATTYSTKSQAQIDAEMTSHSVVSRMWEETRIENANKDAIKELNAAIDNVLARFNSSLKEIISAALPDFIIDAVSTNSKNLEENPANADQLYEELGNISDSEFPEFKKVLDYYDISLNSDINTYVGKAMFNHYVETGRCDYDSTRLRFYRFVLGGGDNFTVEQATIRCYNKIWDAINQKIKGHFTYEYRKGVFDDVLVEIDKCGYLTSEQRTKLINRVNQAENDWVTEKKSDKKKFLKRLVKSIIITFLICIGMIIALLSSNVNSSTLILIIGAAVAPFIISAVKIISFSIKWRN